MSSPQPPHTTAPAVSIVGIVGIVMMGIAIMIPISLFLIANRSRTAPAISPPLSYRNLPFPTVRPVIIAGDVVEVVVDRCNSSPSALTFTLTRSLVRTDTGAEIVLPEETTTAVSGCSAVISTLTTIPKNTPAGYYYVTYLAHSTGRPWTQPVPSRTAVFEVVTP